MFKLIGKIIRFLLFIVILAAIFHNWTAKFLFATGLQAALGVRVKVKEVKINFSDISILFGDIEIGNPYSFFSQEPLARIPKVFMDVAISSFWEKRIHFEAIDLNIQELHVIRDRDGRINLLSLKTFDQDNQQLSQPSEQKTGQPLGFQIDQMILSLGRVRYTDSMQPDSQERGFYLGMDRARYENIGGLKDIVKVISWETLKRIGLEGLAAGLGNWGSSSGNIVGKVLSTLRDDF